MPMIDVNTVQRKASNPLSSVWVGASAGSGKTKVLTDRVLNLLLLTGHPERILCLTFTKTAAAVMANRINDVLKSWAIMPDKELSEKIEKLSGEIPTEKVLARARQLFAFVLDTPGGMKIMTIHSFCQSVLQRFPLEAGISPHFEVADDTTVKDILSKITHNIFQRTDLQKEIALLSLYLNEDKLIEVLNDMIDNRLKLLELRHQYSSLNAIINKLYQNFNLSIYDTEKNIIKTCNTIEEWQTKKKKYICKNPRKIKDGQVKNEEAYLVYEENEKLNALQFVRATSALLRLSYAVIEQYEQEKRAAALLDYEDLIGHTKQLLSESNKAAWVLYKLDGGLDHILVDEAQDTNPDQWQIIRMLAEEFFSGIGASDQLRTIFAVGDKKQSIYSFQGADPQEFEKMRKFFEKRIRESENEFETVPFNFSFRSTEPVLRLVNYVLKSPQGKLGVLSEGEDGTHLAFRKDDAGLVEIWPTEQAEKQDTPMAILPESRVAMPSSKSRLAQKIALKIKELIDSKEILESAGRPIQAGDFLILVQRRNAFMSEMVRFLKEYQIPVAGVDRLVLSEHIAVQDLISLAKFALLPEDDLNLAELLKSPLLGLGEDDLFKVCYNRGNNSVWTQVQRHFPVAAEWLKDVSDQADKMPPFEFFSYVLSVKQGRKHFIGRLGNEVQEALDEFLNLALTFEQNGRLSLESFLKWLGNKKIEIKRDLDQSDLNAVRIMTVHGSKGLQGNIVFLPDTRFVSNKKPSFVWLDGIPVWVPGSALAVDKTDELFEAQKMLRAREYRRLLYVALTRAQDRLYICGFENKTKAAQNNWYDIIREAVPNEPDEDGIIRFSSRQLVKKSAQQTDTNRISEYNAIPSWALTPPPVEPEPSLPLSPSKALEEDSESVSVLDEAKQKSLERGTFIHKMLQYLPTIPVEKRQQVLPEMTPTDIDVPPHLCRIFEDEKFKFMFGAHSLAEVPIVGVYDGQAISGQIDRLVILENEVILVDYKSNRYVPKSVEQVPALYKNQLRLYRGLLKNIFPDKVIKSYLLWVQDLSCMEIQ